VRVKPAGSVCRLTYQTPEVVEVGDAIVTATTGRAYLVIAARRMRSKKPGMWMLDCIVADELPPDGVRVHPLVWWSRERKTPRR
jgi:hypothetical protein